MADINNTVDTPPAHTVGTVGEWTASENTRNFAYLLMMCQAFQDKVIEYYMAAEAEDQAGRLIEICQKLTEIKFEDGTGHIFTIAPTRVRGVMTCGDGEKPIPGGFCAKT